MRYSEASIRIFWLGSLLLVLAACATAAQPEAMVPQIEPKSQQAALRGAGLISIGEVGGGEETDPMWVSKVGNKEFREALRLSLERQGFLCATDGDPSYRLDTFLVELKQPLAGFTITVTSIVRYKLVRLKDNEPVFDELITTSYEATLDDAFVGIERLRLANEGSVRENIAKFLERLFRLDLVSV